MIEALLWYLVSSVSGWLAFPLAHHFLPALPDRGYSISRALGWLLWGYFFWLFASLGLLRNETSGILLAGSMVATASAWTLRKGRWRELLTWLRGRIGLIVSVELVFLVAFFGYAVVRAANPDATGTEKPMELAFINAIIHSPDFPPHDPWLSGYAISYYYFGYVLVALLAKITGTLGSVAFNLGIVLVFALCAISSYGLLYNLLQARRAAGSTFSSPEISIENHGEENQHRLKGFFAGVLPPLLGPIFLLLVSNLEGFLHVLHTRGIFWKVNALGGWSSIFWTWLDIKDLSQPPSLPFKWVPDRFWWWWRASRVIQDYDLMGQPKEIINEFPAFSFLLADLHPHVLVMPFTFVCLALALNLALGGSLGRFAWFKRRFQAATWKWIGALAPLVGSIFTGAGIVRLAEALQALLIWQTSTELLLKMTGGTIFTIAGIALIIFGMMVLFSREQLGASLSRREIGAEFQLGPTQFLLAGVAFGSLAFLNTWDFPFYVALFSAIYALRQAIQEKTSFLSRWRDFLWMGGALGLLGVLLYLPFYLGFSSQAGGIAPNLVYPTRGAHLWVMFAPLVLPLLIFLIYKVVRSKDAIISSNQKGLLFLSSMLLALGLVFLIWLLSFLYGLIILNVPQSASLYLGSVAGSTAKEVLEEAIFRRLTSPGGWITLTLLLGFILAAIRKYQERTMTAEEFPSSTRMAFIYPAILLGGLFVIGPEFFYLLDQFGWRMNTIFKFYFQAWLLWSIVAAYASVLLFSRLRKIWAGLFSAGWITLLSMSLVYPALGVWEKISQSKPLLWTLDSTAYLERQSPDEFAAVRWLAAAPPGVVAEAVPPGGGSYTNFGRVSMISGQPAVLGWVGHESQWRGGGEEMGTRQSDLERLYCSNNWEEARLILEQYSIRYVFIGLLERNNYSPGSLTCKRGIVDVKFRNHMNLVFQQGDVVIFEYIPPMP